MDIVHLTASTQFGGPERQMLGLAETLRATCRTSFVSFAEGGRCAAMLDEARRAGFAAHAVKSDTPHVARAARELTDLLRELQPGVICCHGYKADLLGWWAARRLGVPVIAVSRGWTWENRKVRAYEAVDRYMLRWVDCVVAVSEGQAQRVRRAGVPRSSIRVIRNAIRAGRFDTVDPQGRARLLGLFPSPPRQVVGAAGRLSPEKGHDVFIRAAAKIVARDPAVGFVIFGEGPLREQLQEQVRQAGLERNVVLAGHRGDLDVLTPHLDVSVLASHTEGLPNVVLEAMAAGVPVVATAVGGTPEVVANGVTGHLVPAGDIVAISSRVQELLASEARRQKMGAHGQAHVREHFTFDAQARAYTQLFEELRSRRGQCRLSLGAIVRRASRRVRVDRPFAAVAREVS